jgi:hypothetical protein
MSKTYGTGEIIRGGLDCDISRTKNITLRSFEDMQLSSYDGKAIAEGAMQALIEFVTKNLGQGAHREIERLLTGHSVQ